MALSCVIVDSVKLLGPVADPRLLPAGVIDRYLHRFAGLEHAGRLAAGQDLDRVAEAGGDGAGPEALVGQ